MTHRPYPSYKDSGIEWLGEVPEHWEVKRLGFLTNRIGSGKTPSGGAEVYGTDGVLFIRSQNVYDDGLRLDDVAYISEQIDEEMKWSRVQSGDVLLNITGASLGRTCLVPDDFCPANVNQHVCVIRLNSQDQRFFVAQAMKSISVKTQIDAIQNGAAREGLNFEQISKITMPLPPLPEQQAIAAFLDRETAKIDGLVAEQERLIELLTEKRSAVISHAVTRGLDPSVPLKDSGVEWLGKVPEHWEITQSRRWFSERKDRAQEGDEQLTASQKYGILSQKEFMEIEGQKVVQVIYGADILKHVEPNDFVISMRSFQGGLEWSGLRGCISSAYVMLVPCEKVFAGFFKWLFKSSSYIAALQSTTNLVRDGQALRFGNFVLVPLPVVPFVEQQAIAAYLDEQTARFDALMAEARRGIELLKERRTALISAAVTGKIDVREAA